MTMGCARPAAERSSLTKLIDTRLEAGASRNAALVVDGHPIDWTTVCDRIFRAFGLFAANGLMPGHRLAIISTDVSAVSTLMIGGMRYGLGMINLNPDMTAHDFAIALKACSPNHLVIDRAIFDRVAIPQGLATTIVEGAADARGGLLGRLLGKANNQPSGFWAELAKADNAVPPPPPADDAIAMMLFTSGTTSAPKVVMLSHANLAAQLAAFDQVYDYDAHSRILNPLPLHFTDGMLHGPIIAFVTGATLYRPTRFDFRQIEELVYSIHREDITHFIVVPALLSMLDRLGDAFADAFDAPGFRYIRSSGDALPEPLWRAIEQRFKVKVVNTYGMSETVCEATYAGPEEASRVIGSIGRPVGCELAIVSADGSPVPSGEEGELLVRGDIVMAGYLDQPELTAAAIQDGWLRTGDLATMDEHGIVRLVGRKKALIISAGVNVQPQDVSDWLLTHTDVAEAHAFGLPHALWGEQVAAAVRLRQGSQASAQTLVAYCQKGLSPHKVPSVITIVAELPRNPAGKVLVEPLRAAALRLDNSTGAAIEGDVYAVVRAIAAHEFGVAEETLRLTSEPSTTPGWNSLAHLNFVSAIEAHFGISISAADVLRLHSLQDMVFVVRRSGVD